MAITPPNPASLIGAAKDYARMAKLSGHAQVAHEQFVSRIVKTFEWIFRNFQWGPRPDPAVGGASFFGETPAPAQWLGRIEFQKDSRLNVPEDKLTYLALNRHERRFLAGFGRACVIESMVGVIDVESQRDQSTIRKAVRLERQSGGGSVGTGQLMSFNVAFERMGELADPNRGKLYVRTKLYDSNGVNAGGDAPIANSQTTYRSTAAVLTSAFVTDYNIKEASGAGVKVHLMLDLWGH